MSSSHHEAELEGPKRFLKDFLVNSPLAGAELVVDRDKQEKIQEILDQVDALPILDRRTPEEILGYNEYGAPQ